MAKISLYSTLNQYNPKTKPLLTDVEVIYQSIYNILSTSPYQRPFNPEFGCDLSFINFDLITDITVSQVEYVVLRAIERWETRVNIHPDTRFIALPDQHEIQINLVFTVVGLGEKSFTLQANITR